MPRFVAAAVLFVLFTFPAVAFGTPPLRVPWPCGTSYRVTQGHNVGSHTAEGAWAWDIGIPVGGEVVAPADGVVRSVRMSSTTGGCDSAFANEANYVVLAFDDGTEALFLHLQANSSTLSPGDRVSRGQPVARVGLTGWVCGAHLHFQIQRTCASPWWCQSIPAQFEGFGDPTSGTITSDNCPECEAVARRDAELVVDELDAGCFERITQYWWSVAEGHGDHHYYTFGTPGPASETRGSWTFDIEEPGMWRVEAFIPSTEADSVGARYLIETGETSLEAGPIDQASLSGWVDLGTHVFTVGADRRVTLGDNTGEATDLRRKLAYDAIRLTPVEPPEPTADAGAGGDAGDADTGGPTQDSGAGGTIDVDFGADPQAGGDFATGGDTATGPRVIEAEGGCGCVHTGGTPRIPWALLGLLWLRRGRARRRAR